MNNVGSSILGHPVFSWNPNITIARVITLITMVIKNVVVKIKR